MGGRNAQLGLGLAFAAVVVSALVASLRGGPETPDLGAPAGAPDSLVARPRVGGMTSTAPAAGASAAPDEELLVARRAAGAPRDEGVAAVARRGRVVDRRSGLGIEGAAIVWRRGERSRSTTSAADGRFELELAGGDGATLEVTHPRYVDAVRPLPDAAADELLLSLVRSARLEVRIDGAWDPATPPEVRVVRPLRPASEALAATPEARLAVLEDLAPGDVHVAVVPANGGAVLREYVPLASGETTRIGLALDLGGTLEGNVQLLGSLAPLVGARVRLSAEGTDPLGALVGAVETKTGTAGDFQLGSLPAGFRGELVVEAPWGALHVQGVAAGMGPVRVRFPLPARLAGVVRDGSGAPAAGCVVTGRRAGSTDVLREVASDAAGRFELGDVPGGTKLEVTAALRSGRARATVRVPNGGLRSDLELVLAEDLEVRGRVVSSTDDAPVAGATIRVASGPREGVEATTAADGSFALLLPEGRASLALSAPGFEPRTSKVRAAAGAEERELRLVPAAPLGGWVVDGDGWGVPGVLVLARRGKNKRDGFTDARGTFELDALTPGTWSVRAGSGRATSAPVKVEVVEGAAPEPLRLELVVPAQEARGVVTGELVVAGSGEPVAGLEFPKGGRVALDGARFTLYAQPPSDRYSLWVRAPGFEDVRVDGLVLTPGARVEVGRLETRPTSRVRVELTGAPLRREDARVALRRTGEPALPWLRVPREIELVRSRGAWEADGVGRYAWTLEVREGGELRHRERVEVRSRREELRVELGPPGSKRER